MLDLLRRNGISAKVVAAMERVPRERFVADELRARAYDDNALPIGEGQTISQPLMVALMTDALALASGDRVLEVGTGFGYHAAVLSQLAVSVTSVERIDALRLRAEETLRSVGRANVHVHASVAVLGYPDEAPYDAIVVAAGAPHLPRSLIHQLAPEGRLVVPIGSLRDQELVRATKMAHGLDITRLGPCAFVPLVDPEAWSEGDASGASRRIKVP